MSYAVEGWIWRDLAGSLDMVGNERTWMTAVGWNVEADECTVTVPDPANTWVTCKIVNDTAWGRALELGPHTGEYRFRINKGEHAPDVLDLTEPAITQMEDEFPWTVFNDEVMGPFISWLAAKHPDDVERMFRPADPNEPGSADLPRVAPEVRDLWERYTQEFVAEQVSN